MYGCLTEIQYPILHAKYDPVYPIGFSAVTAFDARTVRIAEMRIPCMAAL
jgi:hypothetical protein